MAVRTPEQNRAVSKMQQMTMTRLLKIAKAANVEVEGKVVKKKLVQMLGDDMRAVDVVLKECW